MNKSLILLMLFFPLLAKSRAVFTPAKQILMTSATCQDLQVNAESIIEWGTFRYNMKNTDIPDCYCSSSKCMIDVAPISSYIVKELTNYDGGYSSTTAYKGPNCFNASLVLSGSLPNITFTHPQEMTEILKSPLCKELKPKEKTEVGDIVVVRDQSNKYFEIHSAIYINENLSFSKYGENILMPYSYGTNVEKAYGVTRDECKKVYGIPRKGDQCYNQIFTNHFRCKSLTSFISYLFNQDGGIPEPIRQLYADVSNYDLKISNIAYKGKSISQTLLNEYQVKLKGLYQMSINLESKTAIYSFDQMSLVKIMKSRTISLFEQSLYIGRARGFKNLNLTQ